ncbi:MAG: hypothetical protein V9G09_08225 [Candidatus Nanopelagicales bacterium]
MGEEQVVAAADGLIANTETEAEDLIALYAADPTSITVALPGVDLERVRPRLPVGCPATATASTTMT